jgi:hypothetical protein
MTSENSSWCFPFGFTAPRGQVIFFVQIGAALLVILTAILNLSVPGLCISPEERNFWKISLSSTIAYIFPNPSLRGDAKEEPKK